jgi:hypothetical protein
MHIIRMESLKEPIVQFEKRPSLDKSQRSSRRKARNSCVPQTYLRIFLIFWNNIYNGSIYLFARIPLGPPTRLDFRHRASRLPNIGNHSNLLYSSSYSYSYFPPVAFSIASFVACIIASAPIRLLILPYDNPNPTTTTLQP